jgi:hypothetical protein
VGCAPLHPRLVLEARKQSRRQRATADRALVRSSSTAFYDEPGPAGPVRVALIARRAQGCRGEDGNAHVFVRSGLEKLGLAAGGSIDIWFRASEKGSRSQGAGSAPTIMSSKAVRCTPNE